MTIDPTHISPVPSDPKISRDPTSVADTSLLDLVPPLNLNTEPTKPPTELPKAVGGEHDQFVQSFIKNLTTTVKTLPPSIKPSLTPKQEIEELPKEQSEPLNKQGTMALTLLRGTAKVFSPFIGIIAGAGAGALISSSVKGSSAAKDWQDLSLKGFSAVSATLTAFVGGALGFIIGIPIGDPIGMLEDGAVAGLVTGKLLGKAAGFLPSLAIGALAGVVGVAYGAIIGLYKGALLGAKAEIGRAHV